MGRARHHHRHLQQTTLEKACTWLGEISSCSCLTFLTGPGWVLLSKIYKPFPGSLYLRNRTRTFFFLRRFTVCMTCRRLDDYSHFFHVFVHNAQLLLSSFTSMFFILVVRTLVGNGMTCVQCFSFSTQGSAESLDELWSHTFLRKELILDTILTCYA